LTQNDILTDVLSHKRSANITAQLFPAKKIRKSPGEIHRSPTSIPLLVTHIDPKQLPIIPKVKRHKPVIII